MASFTDNLQYLTNFTPYRQQIPLDEMKEVGVYKQAKYEEGVQKIQTNIDNIAGLDIGRDIDKTYLQSKLNQLGNDLRFVSAGDFSNFQLVNSVNGMTNQIVKDPFVQAAVSSTATDKKQLAEMEADKKAGKLTPHAEYVYNLKRSAYYNNSNLRNEGGEPISFSGQYIPSWDLDKNMLEAIKAVGDSEWSADNVFKMVNGQIAKDKDGVPIYSDYAIREKRKGKFSENITAAIDGVLNRPEAAQELSMRGVYNYRGRDNIEDFVKEYETIKNKTIEKLEVTKLDVMEKVANATTKEERLKYQEVVNFIDSKIEGTKQDAALKESEALQYTNVDSYKAALETMRVRNNYMLSGVTEKTSLEVIENIPWKAQRSVLRDERDWKMALDASSRGWANVDIARANSAREDEKWKYDPKNPNNKLPPTEPALGLSNVFESKYGDLINASNQAEVNLDATKFNIVTEYMSAINFGNGKKLTQEQVETAIKSWEKKTPGFIDAYYKKAKEVSKNDKLATNPLYSKLMSALPTATAAENEVNRLGIFTTNMNKSEGVVASGAKDVDIEGISKTFKPFEIEYTPLSNWSATSFGGGAKIKKTVTAQDALDMGIVAANEGGIKGMLKSLFSNEQEKQTYNQAKSRLENKFDLPADEILNVVRPAKILAKMGGVPVNYGMNPQLKNVIETVNSQKFNNVLKAKEEYLQNHSWSSQPLAYTVYGENMKSTERTSVDDRVKAVLNSLKDSGGGLEDFNRLYTDPKNFTAQISVDRGSTFLPKQDFALNLYDKGGLVKSIPISKDYADYIKGEQIKLPQKPSQTVERIQANGTTTNSAGLPPNHPDAYQGAMIPETYFTQKFNTTKVLGAEVVKSPAGGYNAYLYTIDPRTNDIIGVPIKSNKGDIYPAYFDNADAATQYLTNNVNSKAYLEALINNGL